LSYRAHSSPIIWGNRVYITTAIAKSAADLKVGLYGNIEAADDNDTQQWRLIALDKTTGKIIWDQLGYEAIPKVKRHTKGTHCNSTPVTDGNHIAAIFGSEGLFCFDREGRLIWKKDLGPMDAGFFTVPAAQWGFAGSPIIHDGKVVVQCDVQKDSFLAVFNLADGEEIWRTPRHDVPSWSTPTVVKVGEETQILVNGWHHIGAYDFKTGKEIWKLDGGGDIPVPTPIIANGLAYFTSAHGKVRPVRAIRLQAKGSITPAKISDTNEFIKWVHDRSGNYIQTPVVVGENLYACYDTGVLTCFDAVSGEIHYKERLGSGGGGYSASPVSDGTHIYFAAETGKVFVVPANEKFSIAAENQLGDNCLATPAISDGILFFRTQHKLIAVKEQ